MKRVLFTLMMGVMGSVTVIAQDKINIEESQYYVGQNVTVCGKVFSGRYLQNARNKPTLLNLGGNYPNQLLTVVIFEEDRKYFPTRPEDYFTDKNVCIIGKVQEYRGMPEIIIRNPEQIVIDNGTNTAATLAATAPVAAKPKQPAVSTPAATTKPVVSAVTEPVVTETKQAQVAEIKQEVVAETQPVATEKPTKKTKEGKTVVAPTPAFQSREQYDIKLSQDVNMRVGPAANHQISVVLSRGTTVTILGSAEGWSYVSAKWYSDEQKQNIDLKGYIKNSVLK